MKDYAPLDLADWLNAGQEFFDRGDKFVDESWHPPAGTYPLGEQVFRGLPFQVGGGDPKSCLVYFGPEGYREPVSFRIQRRPRWLIVAHRLLETGLYKGEPVGKEIAVYTFCYADGKEIRCPIRERLEISIAPPRWGQLPLLAEADQEVSLLDRERGSWNFLGWRLTEVGLAWPRWFVLWAWKNPFPDAEVVSMRVEPGERGFVIGAVTASYLDEDPIGNPPKKVISIRLKDPGRRKRPFSISTHVDRGQAFYAYALPEGKPEDFLRDELKGFGQADNLTSLGAYTQVIARPSARLQVLQEGEVIDQVQWKDLLSQGKAEGSETRIEIIDQELNWVHTRVIDTDTGVQIPCRVHFRSIEGVPYAPHGHHDHLLSDQGTVNIDVGGDVRLGQATYAYIDGACQGWLPSGEVIVDVARGFEYEPCRKVVQIQRGQRELVIPVNRKTDLAAQGWYCGDTHVHFLSTSGALLEGQGEGLSVLNLLQTQWGTHFSNTEEFVGRPVATPDGNTIVYTSQENRQHILGHLSLLGLKSPVMPWCSDGASEAEFGGTLETTLSHWADECHARGGTVILPHFPDPNLEAPALIATHRADAIEMITHDPYSHLEYYRYLNGGYRLPLVGGTDKMSGEVPVGLYRTYVHIPPDQPFSYEAWIRGLTLGRTFLTSGPLIRLTVDGKQIGETIYLPGNGGTVEVMAEASSIFPIHTLQIVQEGNVAASVEEKDGRNELTLQARLKINHNTWLAARAGGRNYFEFQHHHDELKRGVMAHTSPIYLSVGEKWEMSNPETYQYMLTLLHGGLEYIRERSTQHLPGQVTHHHHEPDHMAYLERPLHEAIRAVEARGIF